MRILLRQSFCITNKKEIMKHFNNVFLAALALMVTLTSCELAGGIFKAGAYTAIIGIVLVVILIIWLVSRFRK
jgi:hypothetical protein